MKNFFRIIFGKLTIGGIIILLQFLWIAYLIYGATRANSLINTLLLVAALILSIHIANKEIRTSFKTSWIFLILGLPIFGIPAYFLFGRAELTRRAKRRLASVSTIFRPLLPERSGIREELRSKNFYAAKQSAYITDFGGYPLYHEDSTKYYSCGEEVFGDLLEDLRSAKDFIFMEYFIIARGTMLDQIMEILEEKVKEGVKVRIIYDDFGCVDTLPANYYKILQAKGMECANFNPFRPVLSVVMNNRDHRKITVIDGRIAYTGGFNLADEYINKITRFGYWKDEGIRITGECVWSFTVMFLEMWSYITGTHEECIRYRAALDRKSSAGKKDLGYIQPFSDSPMDNEYVGENVYLNLINHAKHYVYIFTPYLILGSEMMTALTNAAKSGVDVRIVVPGIPDKKLVYLLTQSHFSQLTKSGVKVYRYTPGFIHSKCFVVDDEYAVVGTINLDYRSLCLHFECGAFMYKTQAVLQVKEDALATISVSDEVGYFETQKKALIVRIFFGILKLCAPLL